MFERKKLCTTSSFFSHKREVRFQDVDAAGIVFFARFFEFFHDAYVAFLYANGISLDEVLLHKKWAAPIKHAEADFLAPVRFGDVLDVGLTLANWEKSILFLGYRMTNAQSRVVAVGETQHVFVDYTLFSRIDPPPDLVAIFAPFVDQVCEPNGTTK